MTKILIDTLTKIANVNAMDYEYQRWAKEALKALEQAQKQEPEQAQVFCMHWEDRWGCNHYVDPKDSHPSNAQPLYTSPPQPQQPVSWESILGAIDRAYCYEENANKTMDSELTDAIAKELQALFTQPQEAAPRKPLTDEEIESIFKAQRMVYNTNGVTFARAIEAAHGIKE